MRCRCAGGWPTAWIALSALLAIVGSGAAGGSVVLHYLFKPLTTALIFGVAWRIARPVSSRYRRAVLIGIALSLCGDVFLMLPKAIVPAGFLLGLSSFLIAHLFFLRAFTADTRLFARPLVLVAVLAFGGASLGLLWPGLEAGLKLPVVVYMLCLGAMAAQAITRHLQLQQTGSRVAALGGMIFLLSDTLLAYNKFHAAILASAWWILGTYYTALLLIAHSIGPAHLQPDRAGN